MPSCESRAGAYSVATTTAGVTAIRRTSVDWLPPPHISPLTPDGKRWSPVWYRFFREMSENRLGGIDGVTVPQVATAANTATAAASTVGVFATQVLTYAEEINTAVVVTKQVAVDNSLTGAEDIPDGPGSPPTYEP